MKPSTQFVWTDDLNRLINSSKDVIIQEMKEGMRLYDPDRSTCLATYWPVDGIGFFLMQKYYQCTAKIPACCLDGWKLCLVGSRFSHPAESCYAPIESEALTIVTDISNRRLLNLNEKTNSWVTTIFGSDAYRVFINTRLLLYILAIPVFLSIGTAYVFYIIGLWCFVAFATFLFAYTIQIGDRGTTLSGGQKQRVSLVRPVYSQSDICLLDDPLSAVDVHVGQHHCFGDSPTTGLRFRSAILGMTYKKLMKLKSMNGRIASEVITIFGSDAYRVFINTQVLVYLLSIPVFLLIGTAYVYYLIGLWCFVAFATFLFFYTIQIRKMSEVLASMKLLKMYAWEESFENSIRGIRETETRPMLQSSILNLISNAIMPITPSLATVATIAMYVNAGNKLTASTGFSIVATLGFLRGGLFYVPYAARILGETIISFKRIKRFMLEEEFKPPGRNIERPGNAIELCETVFMWESDNNNEPHNLESKEMKRPSTKASSFVLRNIDITVSRGKHIGVCGTVGCGKSSLMQAMIGRMALITGHLAVDGTVAYAAQQAWIFNGSLMENILFGNPYKQDWYIKVLDACNLEPDLRQLPNGDATEIGDKGINLSGGQKQRVSLARAVYSQSDIYLLDDPLSAVDVHVGQHLFHKCIDKVLKDKTVVLVTHQLQYLKQCDDIYVMDDGKIAQHGTHESLLADNGHYTKLMEQFNSKMDYTSVIDDEHLAESNEDLESVEFPTNEQQIDSSVSVSCDDNYEKGILTIGETSKAGEISMEAYMSYVRAAGGKIVAVGVFLLYVCSISSVTFSDWWLGLWIEQTNTRGKVTLPSESNAKDTHVSVIETATTYTVKITNTTPSLEIEEIEGTDWYMAIYVYTTVVITGLAVLKGWVAGVVMTKAAVNLHNTAVGRVISAPLQFFDANPPGRLLNRFSRDVEDADVYIPHMMDNLLQVLLLLAASLVTTAYNFPLFLIAVVPIGCYFFVIKTLASIPIINSKRLENVLRSPLISHVTTSCSGLNTIVSYAQENNFIKGCQQYTDMTTVGMLLFDSSMRWMGLRLDIGGSVIAIITTIVVLSTKDVISPVLAALSLTMCINNLEIEKETGSLQVNEKWPSEGRIMFSNVEMKYRIDMDPVLKNISFDILSKQKVGIVGRTGAGKSSLAAALFRLTDLSEGHVFIDDVEIGSVSRKLLRSNLSSIPQDPVLFAGSLRYNLDPFNHYSDDKIWAALEQVHMKEKIKLLDQTLDLYIAENGENFSVGERQLICLARAILRENKILVLDEATASIDTATDAMIQETVRDSFSDCTVLTIAHRLHTVLHCDVILVMDAGRVLEMGNPQDLLQSPCSHFNKMIRAQTVLSPDA
ncbi:multidrug resistance-associated protein 9-like [Mizuhopecten yessoensis]|uniref:multidrug resistance-associated protein 9-like n=1 Tax=Mizuhopecten yessoensis TaxID=6573 RepID=UPI000B45C273|nr:multidrug resistance-associated protein 9-like [Mizuhopecten yessoensis]